jgi:tRNA A-37 threonylcarbamoyl transferase component Bud32
MEHAQPAEEVEHVLDRLHKNNVIHAELTA